jgi:hypothetical protein
MERRYIDKHIGNGSLQSRGIEKVIPRLQVRTPICSTLHRVEKRVQIGENMYGMSSNRGGGVSIGCWGMKFIFLVQTIKNGNLFNSNG